LFEQTEQHVPLDNWAHDILETGTTSIYW